MMADRAHGQPGARGEAADAGRSLDLPQLGQPAPRRGGGRPQHVEQVVSRFLPRGVLRGRVAVSLGGGTTGHGPSLAGSPPVVQAVLYDFDGRSWNVGFGTKPQPSAQITCGS